MNYINTFSSPGNTNKEADLMFYQSTNAYAEAFSTDCIYETCKVVAPLLNHHTFMKAIKDEIARDMDEDAGD